MTRLAVLADIHGNLPALEAVIRDLADRPIDHVIVAGDVINWGPFSAQVVERVAKAGWAVTRGNNEDYLLDFETPRAPSEWGDRSQYPLLPWLRRQLAGRPHHTIAAWPDNLCLRFPNAPPIRVVHGSPRRHTEPIYPTATDAEITTMLGEVEESVVIAGHTHLPLDRSVGRWRVLNPGSVGVPLDGTRYARYLLLEAGAGGWRPHFREVLFDMEPVLREFERQRFTAECGVIGEAVVAEFEEGRLVLHPFLAWRRACRPHAPITPKLWEEFATVDRWTYTPRAYHPIG
jgi:predicted phosphodiesterase